MPARPGLPKGTLATWGQVVLEPIVGDEIRLLGEGKPLSKGIPIDFIGDFARSARQGLPVYRLGGGAGFVWAASYNETGRGTLRFSAVDASAYSRQTLPPAGPAIAAAPPISPSSGAPVTSGLASGQSGQPMQVGPARQTTPNVVQAQGRPRSEPAAPTTSATAQAPDTIGGLVTDCRTAITFSVSPDDPLIDSRILPSMLDRRLQQIAKEVAQSLKDEQVTASDIANPPSGLARLVGKFRSGMLDRVGIGSLVRHDYNKPLPNASDHTKLLNEQQKLYGVSSSWIENGTAPQLLACFPDLVAAIREFSPRVKAAITATEQKQKAAQEAASAKQKEDIAQANLPINILGTAYASYVDVKRCQEARDGYSTIYISIPEMNQARDAVRQIEQTMRSKLDQNTTTDDVWSRVATTEGRNFHPSGDYQERTRMLCRERLALLLGILREQAPERGIIEKDF
jgi:hypothetical protein